MQQLYKHRKQGAEIVCENMCNGAGVWEPLAEKSQNGNLKDSWGWCRHCRFLSLTNTTWQGVNGGSKWSIIKYLPVFNIQSGSIQTNDLFSVNCKGAQGLTPFLVSREMKRTKYCRSCGNDSWARWASFALRLSPTSSNRKLLPSFLIFPTISITVAKASLVLANPTCSNFLWPLMSLTRAPVPSFDEAALTSFNDKRFRLGQLKQASAMASTPWGVIVHPLRYNSVKERFSLIMLLSAVIAATLNNRTVWFAFHCSQFTYSKELMSSRRFFFGLYNSRM